MRTLAILDLVVLGSAFIFALLGFAANGFLLLAIPTALASAVLHVVLICMVLAQPRQPRQPQAWTPPPQGPYPPSRY